MDEQRRLLLEHRALAALRERLVEESYLSVSQVAKRLNLSREKVESLPMAILQYEDHGTMATLSNGEKRWKSLRRYHPADVMALPARIRAWRRAEAEGRGEEYLRQLEAELEERDRLATEMAKGVGAA